MTRKIPSLLLLALVLSACDSQPTAAPASTAAVPPPAPLPEPAKPAVAAVPKVIKWGPEHAKAGEAFNVQADGNSGIWFQLDQDVPAGTSITGTFDGKPLIGPVVNGKFGAATIPVDYIATPGTYAMELHIPADGPAIAAGSITVE
jgi:hypothetical protein